MCKTTTSEFVCITDLLGGSQWIYSYSKLPLNGRDGLRRQGAARSPFVATRAMPEEEQRKQDLSAAPLVIYLCRFAIRPQVDPYVEHICYKNINVFTFRTDLLQVELSSITVLLYVHYSI